MNLYTINYQNGFKKEVEGNLEEVKVEAQNGMTYTQTSVSIEQDGEIVTESRWYGIAPTAEDYENEGVLEELGGGFYGTWQDW